MDGYDEEKLRKDKREQEKANKTSDLEFDYLTAPSPCIRPPRRAFRKPCPMDMVTEPSVVRRN